MSGIGTVTTPIFNYLGVSIEYVVVGLCGFSLFLFLMFIITQIRFRRLWKRYKAFMEGEDAKSLESAILKQFRELDSVKDTLESQEKKINDVVARLVGTYSKIGIVKYDAFKEMGGKLSFSLALLNDNNDGFILNSMHSREGCYTYVKEIVKGESYIVLADEEKEALNNAINLRNYML